MNISPAIAASVSATFDRIDAASAAMSKAFQPETADPVDFTTAVLEVKQAQNQASAGIAVVRAENAVSRHTLDMFA